MRKISFIGKNPGKRILKRQGMKVTPLELRNLASKLECEFRDTLSNIDVKLRDDEISNKGFIIPIVNKSKASDTWELPRM